MQSFLKVWTNFGTKWRWGSNDKQLSPVHVTPPLKWQSYQKVCPLFFFFPTILATFFYNEGLLHILKHSPRKLSHATDDTQMMRQTFRKPCMKAYFLCMKQTKEILRQPKASYLYITHSSMSPTRQHILLLHECPLQSNLCHIIFLKQGIWQLSKCSLL